MRRFFRHNGLTIVLSLLFVGFLFGQSLTGQMQHNQDQMDHGQPTLSYLSYLGSSHFLEATMENWESEFLQMFGFIVLTAFLFQKGSAESKDPDKKEKVDRDPPKSGRRNVPWPVKRGGLFLKLYGYSLSLVFFLLFLMSFILHAVGGAQEYNSEQKEHGRRQQQVTVIQYMGTSQFWFESFQNWQSEFLAVGSMVVLTIFLRQRGSAESKPVDAPHSQTGE